MNGQRKSDYLTSANKLLAHLDSVLHPEVGYPDEPSWGYAFSYLASALSIGDSARSLSDKALHFLNRQDIDHANYSWEFVVYALQQARHLNNEPIRFPVTGYREKGTRMFNWFLLRNVNKKLCNRHGLVDLVKLRAASWLYQDKSGLILDEFRTRSLQYHAFCLFMLSELLEHMPTSSWLRQWFSRGIDFAVENILSDGTAMYIGRGQEQIFGYGSLLYAMEYCHRKIKPIDDSILERLKSKLLAFQRDDGSFPLVLRQRQPEQPAANFKIHQPDGWYGYNTLYDYQPFLAYCLLKAGRLD